MWSSRLAEFCFITAGVVVGQSVMGELYVLEVQRFNRSDSFFDHVGYMNKLFSSKKKACDYYALHNPGMRGLNAHGHWASDWDPETLLRYVLRRYRFERLSVEGW